MTLDVKWKAMYVLSYDYASFVKDGCITSGSCKLTKY
jgi:hypothetical protein